MSIAAGVPVSMPRRIIAVFAFVVASASASATSVAAQQGGLQRLPRLRDSVAQSQGRVIVTLKSDRPGSSVRLPGTPPVAAAEQAQIVARLGKEIRFTPHGSAPLFAAVFATVDEAQLASLLTDRNVELVEPDVLVTLSEDRGSMESIGAAWNRMAETTPWGITQIGAPQAWAGGNTGVGAKIGIIDSGISLTQPDLTIGGGFDFPTNSSSPSAYDDNIGVCNGHGTHVAGITAAKQNGQLVVGVAPGAKVYALKVFEVVSGSCSSWSSHQIAAINWAVANDLDVVNFSLASSSGLASYQNAIDAATAAGLVIVAATGNNGATTVTFPARYQNVIAVGALDQNNVRAWFSNAGPEMWVAAPGTGIVSTMPGGGTASKSGTSMAAPHVAGLVALMRSANPTWTVTRIRDELRLGAIDVGTLGFDAETGYGLARAPTSGGTPPPPVVTLAVSPASRLVSVVAGTAAPSASATVTLAGGSPAWTATKRKAWTTLTTSTGTGSGTVQWTRNTTGLVAGTYVDTIAVTATGALGSPGVVYDSLVITSASTPVTLAVSPAARSASVVAGSTAPSDSATVTLAGTNASTTGWSATKKKAWTTLSTASGTGSGKVRWTRNATGLAAGTYVDTISVAATGVAGSPKMVFDTLRVTAVQVPLSIAATPTFRSISVASGASAPKDSATVTVSGTNAASVAWTAAKKKAWTTLTTGAGTGSAKVRWTRSTSALAVGTYVDTITVSASGVAAPAIVIDSIRVTPVPQSISLGKKGKRSTVQAGTASLTDSVDVSIAGTGGTTATWTATRKASWNTLTAATGTGAGQVRWTRTPGNLAVGTYVDTITVVTGSAAPAVLYDTLAVLAGPVPLTLRVSPPSMYMEAEEGTVAAGGFGDVTVEGAGFTTAQWTATKRKPWTVLATSTGTGSGTVTWLRNIAGLTEGVYVDTITVTVAGAAGSPTRIIDTLRIVAGSPEIIAVVSPALRSVRVVQGTNAPADSAVLSLSGAGASSVTWNAASRTGRSQLTTWSGTGPGVIRWSRSTSSLPVGEYVDTITVQVSGIAAVYAIDSVSIVPPNLAMQVSPAGRHRRVTRGFGQASIVALDSATVSIYGTDAPASPVWIATTTSSWIKLSSASGPAPGVVTWSRDLSALGNGVHVDSIVMQVQSDPSIRSVVRDTIELVEIAVPTPERAAEELFSAGRIDGAQRDALDQSGNRNGRYDLGDFLAWVDRSGIRLSAALMDKLMTVPADKREQPAERARREQGATP